MPTFSVIIPIHNAESTLRRCLDSLHGQSFSDFEVLMVENGSSDSSHDICRAYASDDARFRPFRCGQLGPSGARNIGLEHARGAYITFVDSDDYVTSDYLQQLHRAFLAQRADVVFFGYRQVAQNGAVLCTRVPHAPENLAQPALLTELSRQDMFGYAWVKAFRAKAIAEKRFPQALDLMEDEVFACEVLAREQRIALLPSPLYFYVTGNVGSLMGRTHPDFCQKLDVVYRAWERLLSESPNGDALLRERAASYVSKCMYYGFERDVEPDAFFQSLSRCAFFADAAQSTAFYQAVKNEKRKTLRRMRAKYRLKTAVAKLLGR